LNRIITFLEQNPTIGIVIEGHTDNSGESGYNLDLSEKRAKAVHGYLIKSWQVKVFEKIEIMQGLQGQNQLRFRLVISGPRQLMPCNLL